MPTITYFVLPPAHGKTTLHQPEQGIYDFESIVEVMTNLELATLRARAKETGNWVQYDNALARVLETTNLTPPGMILLPCHAIAKGRDWSCAGACILDRAEWRANLAARGDKLTNWFETLYVAAQTNGADFRMTNVGVSVLVHKTAQGLLDKKSV